MTRTEYIKTQRREHGRKALAVLPVHYPKEILTAMNLLAVEVWGPPGPPRGPAAGRIQPYVCAIVRNSLAFMAAGGADTVDGALFPHTCDSLQNLATVAPDLGGWEKPVFRFYHAKGEDRPSARDFVARELRALARELEQLSGEPLDVEALRRAVALHREIDGLRAVLLDRRRFLVISDSQLYSLLRRGEWLWPEDHLRELQATRAMIGEEPVQRGAPVLVTGYVPEPMSLLATLNGAGAWVAADDYAAVGRRVVRGEAGSSADPFETLVDLYFSAPPCSTRAADPAARLAYLEGLLEQSGSLGVVVHLVKFCEPDLFDVPLIRKRFEKRDVPVLVLEGELERELSGQVVTRLEAFVEMLVARGRAA